MALDVGTLAGYLDLDTKPFDDKLDGVAGKLGGLGGPAAAAGAVAGALLAKGFAETMNIEAANDKLAAQLGLSEQAAESFGRAAGNLYANAYGESLEQVNEALKNVQQNIGDNIGNADDALETTTGHVLDLAQAFDADLSMATQAVGTIMRTGLAASAEEAFDVITVGMQNGANKADDLLETFQEYSTMFREIGLSAADAMGLITQGLQAGARDADTVADALKEFAIRGQDASTLSAEGFEAIGLGAEEMTAKVAQGGPAARDALDQVLDRLRVMEDPVARNAAAVALFGTKAEDLGDSLFALDPTTAVEGLGEVSGAAQRMGDTLADNASTKIEKFKRQAMQRLTDFVGGTVIPGLERLRPTFEAIGAWVDDAVSFVEQHWPEIQDTIEPVIQDIQDVIQAFIDIVETLWENFGDNILDHVERVWPHIQRIIEGAFQIISGIFEFFAGLLTGDWGRMWDGITQIIGGAWDMIVGLIGVALDGIKLIVGIAFEILRGIVTGAWDSIKGATGAAWDWIFGKVSAVVDFITGLPGTVADIGSGMWEGLKGGLVAVINWIIDQLNKINFTLPSWVPGLGGKSFGFDIDRLGGSSVAGGGTGGTVRRMHSGGHQPGAQSDEFLRVLQGGETVLARNDPVNLALQGRGPGVGGGGTLRLIVDVTGGDQQLVEMFRSMIREEGGGDVQAYLGQDQGEAA